MIKLLVILVFAAGISQALNFTCPVGRITLSSLTGNLPFEATGPTYFLANTSCTLTFAIPNGYALLLQLSADFKSDNDSISVVDNLNKVRELSHIGRVSSAPVWFAAEQAQIRVVGVSGNSRFYATYQYKFLNAYTQVKKSTGEYFALSLLSNKNYYTFTSKADDKVVVTNGKKTSSQLDGVLSQIFVYDGDDIRFSKMIGTLEDFGSSTLMSSTGSSLTLVNFYGTMSQSYVVGNDASTLEGFFKYSVIVTSSGTGTSGTLGDLSGLIGAYTFICTDCNKFYITKFDFDGLVIDNSSYTKFQGQTPTHRMEKLIGYSPVTYTPGQMPQLIPTGVFTLNVHLSKVSFNINTLNDATAWETPYHRRKGFIFSTNLWNRNAVPNTFNYEFYNASELYTYSVNTQKMDFGLDTDKMTLQIGSESETPGLDKKFSRQNPFTGNVSEVGSYMRIGFLGSANDDIRMTFEMLQYSSSGAIGILSSVILALFWVF